MLGVLMRSMMMTEYEVNVPVIWTEHGRHDYIVKANSYEEAIKLAKEGKYDQVYSKTYGPDNVEEFWDEAEVATL